MTQKQAEDFLRAALKCEIAYRRNTYKTSAQLERYIAEVAEWLTTEKKFGLLMCGLPGNGKTTMMQAIRTVIGACDLKTEYEHASVVVKSTEAKEICFMQKNDYAAFKQLCRAPIIAIDDLGVEPVEILDYGNVLNPVIDLLSYRYNEQLMTIVTTNLTPKQIREKYGERIADRFNEMMTKIIFEIESYRVKFLNK